MGVTVCTTDGEHAASAAIVALPANALGAVRFDPPLSDRREAAEEGLVSLGLKVWAKLAPGFPRCSRSRPIGSRCRSSRRSRPPRTAERSSSGSALGGNPPPRRPRAGGPCGRGAAPEARVEDVGGHDRVRDPLAGETWASYGPGRSLRWLPELERPEGRVAFAGAIARGWGPTWTV